MFDQMSQNWQDFVHNFRWDDYVAMFNGIGSKFVVLVPLIGYLIIFNDIIIDNFGFETLIGHSGSELLLTDVTRLKLVYFGLIILALSHLTFRLRKPLALRQVDTQEQYIKFAHEVFSPRDYIEIEGRISKNGHTTLYGKDELCHWESFREAIGRPDSNDKSYNYTEALKRYKNLTTCLAIDNFVYQVTSRKKSLLLSLILYFSGVMLLAVPSIDLFLKVLISSFS